MKLNTIFFIGPQGSGKGTQAKILGQRLDFFYWEMGGILRSLRTQPNPSELATEVTKLMDQGVLLTDSMIEQVVSMKLSELPENKGVIFDGIPRRMGQAQFLFTVLESLHRTDYATVFIDLPRQESLERLLKRAETENRPDDTREKIEFRLDQYYKDTIPVVEYLKQRTAFFEIDGRGSIEEVTSAINRALEL